MRLAATIVVISSIIALVTMIAAASLQPQQQQRAFAQGGQQQVQAFDVVKAERSESFSVPYGAANLERSDPFVYKYEVPKGNNWILSLENALSYVSREDAKAVIILREQEPGTKFVEIQMYGGESKKYSVWVNTPETGYTNAYLSEERGWSKDQPIGVTYGENAGLRVTDGKRTIIDRLNMRGFNLGSIEVYGKDAAGALSNAHAGSLNIGVIYGNPADTPVYFVPAIVTAGMAAIVGALLVVKKRKR